MKIINYFKDKDLLKYTAIAVLLLGITLRIKEYLQNRTLTWDESAVILSVMDKSYAGLLNLYYDQRHPYLFLVIVKAITGVIGTGELAFRLLPLISGVLGFILFYFLARLLIGKRPAILATIIFGISGQLISYSAIFREYSTDVALTIAAYLLLLKYVIPEKMDYKAILLLSLFGVIAVWVSNPSYFVLFTSSIVIEIYFLVKKRYESLLKFGIISLFWGVSMLANYLMVIRSFTHASVVFGDFNFTGDFATFPPATISDILWYFDRYLLIFRFDFGFFLPSGILFIIGFFFFAKKNKLWFSLLVSPLLFAFILSTAKWWPLTGRHLLFTAPAIILFVTYGLAKLLELGKKNKFITFLFCVSIMMLFVHQMTAYINIESLRDEQDNLKQLMKILESKKHPGDWIYLYNTTAAPFKYYAPRYHLDKMPYKEGQYRTSIFVRYLSDITPLIGKKRVWVIFTHNYNWGWVDEQEFIVGGFDSQGKQIGYYQAGTSTLYLFDLSKK